MPTERDVLANECRRKSRLSIPTHARRYCAAAVCVERFGIQIWFERREVMDYFFN